MMSEDQSSLRPKGAAAPVSAADWRKQRDADQAARRAAAAAEEKRLRDYRAARQVPPGKLAPDPGLPPAEVMAREQAQRAQRREQQQSDQAERIARLKAAGRLGHF